MISSLINTLLFVFLFLPLIFLARKRGDSFYFYTGFLIPLITPGIKFGVNVFWFSIIGPTALLILMSTQQGIRRVRYLPEVKRFILYTVVLTLVWFAVEYFNLKRSEYYQQIGFGGAQSEFKMPIQLFRFVSMILPIFILPASARSGSNVRSSFIGFAAGTLFSAAFGIILLLLTGRGMITDAADQAIVKLSEDTLSRIGGLSGEPKHLGTFLVVVIAYASSMLFLKNIRAYSNKELYVIIFPSMAFLWLTYSTSAWIGLLVFCCSFLFFAIRSTLLRTGLFIRIIMVSITICAVLMLVNENFTIPFLEKKLDSIEAIVRGRLYERISLKEDSRLHIQKENYIMDVYKANPEYLPVGFGIGGFDLEAIPFNYYNDFRVNFTPSANGMRLLGELGIIGILLLFIIPLKWTITFLAKGRNSYAYFTLCGFLAILTLSINAIPAYLYLLGGLIFEVNRNNAANAL